MARLIKEFLSCPNISFGFLSKSRKATVGTDKSRERENVAGQLVRSGAFTVGSEEKI
jgi:hypothetical protein